MASVEPGKAVFGTQVKRVVVVEAAGQALVIVVGVIVAERVVALELHATAPVVAPQCEAVVARTRVGLANGHVAKCRYWPLLFACTAVYTKARPQAEIDFGADR